VNFDAPCQKCSPPPPVIYVSRLTTFGWRRHSEKRPSISQWRWTLKNARPLRNLRLRNRFQHSSTAAGMSPSQKPQRVSAYSSFNSPLPYQCYTTHSYNLLHDKAKCSTDLHGHALQVALERRHSHISADTPISPIHNSSIVPKLMIQCFSHSE
jgi:hypothetical protein